MILSASQALLSLRWIPPAVCILGSSSPFLTNWTVLRVLTWPLPDRIYRRLEEFFYSSYQCMTGFFYETWSGVEVSCMLA